MSEDNNSIENWINFDDGELFLWITGVTAILPFCFLFPTFLELIEYLFGEGFWGSQRPGAGLVAGIVIYLITAIATFFGAKKVLQKVFGKVSEVIAEEKLSSHKSSKE